MMDSGHRVRPVDQFVALSEVRLHVREWTTDRPPVVLLHGLASNAHIWDAVAPGLAERLRVVAMDQRGHGLSSKPDDGYAFSRVAADLGELIGVLGLEHPLLVGHSWGGNVALEHAARCPEAVAGLVLVDGGFLELSANAEMTWERVERELAPPDLTSLTFDELAARVREGDAGAYWNEAVEATLRGSFAVGHDGKVRPRLSLSNHLEILRAMWAQRPSELYGQVRCPVLLVVARRPNPQGRAAEMQAVRERQVARARAAMPDAHLLWMEDTAHDVPLHRPAMLATAILELAGAVDALRSPAL